MPSIFDYFSLGRQLSTELAAAAILPPSWDSQFISALAILLLSLSFHSVIHHSSILLFLSLHIHHSLFNLLRQTHTDSLTANFDFNFRCTFSSSALPPSPFHSPLSQFDCVTTTTTSNTSCLRITHVSHTFQLLCQTAPHSPSLIFPTTLLHVPKHISSRSHHLTHSLTHSLIL